MTIQLTKTKTITLGGGGGGGAAHRRRGDVTGVDLFSNDKRGCPCVRLTERNGEYTLRAAGFVPPPAAPLPSSWEEAAKKCHWSLPAPFQAPAAALAVTSPDLFMVQTTSGAFAADLAAGGHQSEAGGGGGGTLKLRKLGLKRDDKPAKAEPAKAAAGPAPAYELGVPVSNGGTRFVVQPISGSEGFVMEAGIPEFQLLWLSRLLPEGRRPTAASIQPHPSAVAASLLQQKAFKEANGAALAVFVGEGDVHIAGYKDGDLVLWRECRGAPGWTAIREAVKSGLGLDDDMVMGVLNDTLIDPHAILDPLVVPIIDELALSNDYLASKLGLNLTSAFVFGLPAGTIHWSLLSELRARLKLSSPGAFDGLTVPDKIAFGNDVPLEGEASHVFQGALGAALALMGEGDGK